MASNLFYFLPSSEKTKLPNTFQKDVTRLNLRFISFAIIEATFFLRMWVWILNDAQVDSDWSQL